MNSKYIIKIQISFPMESREVIISAMDNVLKLAVSIPQQEPMAFSIYSAFVLFPRLIMRSLFPGCKGRYAALEFTKR